MAPRGEEVMPLPDDVSEAARDLGHDWANIGLAIGDTQIAQDPVETLGWSGESADAYADEARALKEHTQDLASRFPGIKTALDGWADAVTAAIGAINPTLWDQYDTETSAYHTSMDTFDHDVQEAHAQGHPYSTYEVNEQRRIFADTRDQAHAATVETYRQTLATLDEAASTAATAVRAAVDQVFGGDPAPDGRNAIGAALFDDMPLVDGQAEWEYAQEESAAAAQILTNPTPTPDEIREFQEKYGDLCDNPFFATALAERVTPEQMMQFLMVTNLYTDAIVDEDADGTDDFNATISDVVSSLGTAMVLSTGGTNADPAIAGTQASFDLVRDGLTTADGTAVSVDTDGDHIADGGLVAERLDQVKVMGNALYNTLGDHIDPADRSAGAHYGYEYLAQMFAHAASDNPNLALGAEFLDGDDSVARDIVQWDHDHLQEMTLLGRYGDWGTFDDLPGGEVAGLGLSSDPVTSMMLLLDEPAALSDGSLGADTVGHDDLMDESAQRLDAVRGFLLSDTGFEVDLDPRAEGDQSASTTMARYLTGHRLTDSFMGSTDGGEAFGKVLAQASGTEPPPDLEPDSPEFDAWSDRHRQAVEIAGNFMMGYQDGLDSDNSTYHGEDTFGMANSPLRSWAGVILAPHVEGITESLSGRYTGDTFEIDGQDPDGHGFAFGKEWANRFLGEGGLFIDLGFDDPPIDDHGTPDDPSDDTYVGGRAPAIDNLLVAAQHGYEHDIAEALSDGTSLNSVSDRWANILDAAFRAPEDASKEMLEALDERNSRWQKLVTAGVGAVPFGDLVTDSGVNWAIGQAKGNVLTPTLEGLFPTDNADDADHQIVSQGEMAETYMADVMYSAMSTDGQFPADGPTSPAEYCQLVDEDHRFVTDAGDVIPYGEMDSEQRSEFQNYLLYEQNGTDYSSAIKHTNTALDEARTTIEEARNLHGSEG